MPCGNIMDRKRLLKFLSKEPNLEDSLNIIEEYCIEWGKKKEDIERLKDALRCSPMLVYKYTLEALNHFEKKYFITRVYNVSNRGIKLLKIF
jgi:hypothetical protein